MFFKKTLRRSSTATKFAETEKTGKMKNKQRNLLTKGTLSLDEETDTSSTNAVSLECSHSSRTNMPNVHGLLDPLTFYCPISSDIMADPVCAADGYTYDRESIQQHLQIHHWSPMNRKPMDTGLQPNMFLRNLIDGYVQQAGAAGCCIDCDELRDFMERRKRRIDVMDQEEQCPKRAQEPSFEYHYFI